MKGIDSTGAPLVHVPGWVDGWMEVKAVLSIAYSDQKPYNEIHTCSIPSICFGRFSAPC
jgi:hypothetical protein